MPRSVEHDRRHVVGVPAESVRDRADVVRNRAGEVDPAACDRARRPSCACTSAEDAEACPDRRPRASPSRHSPRARRRSAPRADRRRDRPAGRPPPTTASTARGPPSSPVPTTIRPSIGMRSSEARMPEMAASAGPLDVPPAEPAPARERCPLGDCGVRLALANRSVAGDAHAASVSTGRERPLAQLWSGRPDPLLSSVVDDTGNARFSRHIAVARHRRFANDAELECAKILDYYGVPWEYEPRTFVLETDEDGPRDRGDHARLLPARAGPLRRAHRHEAVARDPQEPEAPQAARALPGHQGQALLPARLRAPRPEIRPEAPSIS